MLVIALVWSIDDILVQDDCMIVKASGFRGGVFGCK